MRRMTSQEKGGSGQRKQPEQRQCLSLSKGTRWEGGQTQEEMWLLWLRACTQGRRLPSNKQKTCMKRKKKEHYARVCRSKTSDKHTQKQKIKYVDKQNEIQYVALNHITISGTSKAYATFEVPDKLQKIRFQIDTGASCNVLSWQAFE